MTVLKYTRLSIIPLFVLVFSQTLLAQLMEVTDATTAPITPENLITNIFLGDGVEVLNVSFEGDPISVGYFKNGDNAVGIPRGIVMTTGRSASNDCDIPEQGGADCVGNNFTSYENTSNAQDADLSSIAAGGLSVFNVAKFTITFIPTSDTLRFKYVFASEEYPTFACSPFNDVFGFFISGPGINGPYQNSAMNIALIPGTNTPVTINNVHPANGPNCPPAFGQFYNNNQNTNNQPTYNGYLDVFIAEAVVIPCETYTIKLAISDVGDPAYDTGVFLEAKSFGTGSLKVKTATVSLDGTVTEDCASGSITFAYPSPLEDDFILDYTIIGTAQNGVDYVDIPLDLIIPAGDSSVTIDVVAIGDALDEPLESIGIDIQRDVCNRDTFWMFIRDNKILPPSLGPDTEICQNEQQQLDATLPIPLPVPPSFTNSQDYPFATGTPGYSSIQVAGVQPITLGPGVIQSVCVNIDHVWVDDVDIFLISPGGQFIELSSDNGSNCDDYTNVCFTPNNSNNIGAGFPWPTCTSGGQPSFANGTFAIEGTWEDLWDGEYPSNGTWQLLAIDDQTGFNGTILDWTITFEPFYQVSYSWSPTFGLSCTDCPDPIATPNQTTTYTVTASDTYGCTVQDEITITVRPTPLAPTVNCTDVTNNSITFSWDAVGGPQGYMVSIDGGTPFQTNNTSETINNLGLDTPVTIEVYAISDCNGPTGSATCSTPPCLSASLSIISISNASCSDETNGSLTLLATGGAGDFTYTFNGVSNTTGIFTGIAEGTYTASVVDAWNCPNTIPVNISAPPALVLQPVLVNEITCGNQMDGAVAAMTFGGISPYSFDWSNGQTDSIATNLAAGLVSVTVTDANNCTVAAGQILTSPATFTLTTTADSSLCQAAASGMAQVQIAGGTPPFDILWDAATGNATTATVNNLAAGTYTVTVSDGNDCAAAATATIFEPAAVAASILPNNPACNGTATGTATATANGGTAGYVFSWSNGDTGPMADGLGAGTYTLTVTDANGCSATQTTTLTYPPAMSIQLSATDATCFGESSGSISAAVSNGTQPFDFTWSNGMTGSSIIGIPSGNYCVTVTDATNCTSTACTTINQPSDLLLSTSATNVGCNGSIPGTIDLSVSGGIFPYLFNWSNSQTTEDLNGLVSGDYDVTVTDANGCEAITTQTVGADPVPETQLTQIGVSCLGGNDGAILTTVTGGAGGNGFDWAGPNGFSSTQQNPNGLVAGDYFLTVTDAVGCIALDTIAVSEENALDADFEIDDISCFGEMDGRITVYPKGGVPPYRSSMNGDDFSGQMVFNNLDYGLYDLIIQDANGCVWSQPQIFVNEPKELLLYLGPDTILDYGTTLILTPSIANLTNPGSASFQWVSNNPLLPPVDSTSRIGEFVVTSQASVTLTVIDENGCTISDLINIFVRSAKNVLVPTGFAPGTGGDALNDLLHVHGTSSLVKQIKLFRVFDRWGELLYEAAAFPINDPVTGWDGRFKEKDMPAGVYAWYLEVEFVDGLVERFRGETTLIR